MTVVSEPLDCGDRALPGLAPVAAAGFTEDSLSGVSARARFGDVRMTPRLCGGGVKGGRCAVAGSVALPVDALPAGSRSLQWQ